MNDDIIRMAREAGFERIVGVYKDGTRMVEVPNPELLERFAALVAAAERQRCAQIARQFDATHPNTNYGGCIARLIEETTP